jgi:3-hydroxybutyryl-CoA dehydrogenase
MVWPSHVAVIGAGYMGRGIAQVLAMSGVPCTLADVSAERAAAGAGTLLREARRHERDHLIAPGSTTTLGKRVSTAGSIEAAAQGADYVVEAVYEDAAIKADVLRQVENAVRRDIVISTNTSAISIEMLSGRVEHPERFLGVHWFNPPQFVPGVELIACEKTSPRVKRKVEALLARVGKQPVWVQDSPGFVANRLQYALFQEAAAVVEEGLASAEAVDAVVRTTFGFRLPIFGPFAIADIAGLDVYKSAYRVLQARFPRRFAVPRILDQLVADGHYGAKTGRGFVVRDKAQAEAMAARRDRAYVALAEAISNTERLRRGAVRPARAQRSATEIL